MFQQYVLLSLPHGPSPGSMTASRMSAEDMSVISVFLELMGVLCRQYIKDMMNMMSDDMD